MSKQLSVISGAHQNTRDANHLLIFFSQDNISNETEEQWLMIPRNNGRYFWEQ